VHVNKPILSSSVCLVNSFFLTFGVFQIWFVAWQFARNI
jgi:hypothetical protein